MMPRRTLPLVAIGLLLALLGSGVVAPSAHAQVDADAINLTSQRVPARITIEGTYQWYEDEGQAISQWATPLNVFVPITRGWSLGLAASRADVTGDALEGLAGFDDVQVATTYATEIGASSLVASVAANLPSGKQRLTLDEFQTSVVLSQNYFGFRVAGFGQGFNVAPSLTWAVPVGDRVVVGAGLVYQWRGAYEPLDVLEGQYQPGAEAGGIVGVELRVGPTFTLSADVAHTRYGTDQQVDLGAGRDDVDLLELGARSSARLQARSYGGSSELRIDVRADYYAESTNPQTGDTQQTLPSQLVGQVRYETGLSRIVRGWGLLGARYYEAVDGFQAVLLDRALPREEKLIVDLGLGAAVRLGGGLRIHGRGIYSLGDLDGIEASLGLTKSL
ncbi:MAG: hypothetical protein GVY18_12790 [Bacteroidetes bacterium]|jgi:hypothetical protein|nr:hypothetical protein [Bacteroidota bacterium]